MSEAAACNEMQRAETRVLSFVLFALAILILYACSRYSYLLFHTMVEVFCVLVTLGVFLLAWNSRKFLDNHYFLFLAMSFAVSGVLELLHTFAYKGIGIFVGYDANLPTQLWISFRYVVSLSFLAAPLFIDRKLPIPPALATFGSVAALLILAIFSGRFPDCYLEGKGLTPFKIYSEYLVITILLASAVPLWRNRQRFDRRVLMALIASVLSAAAADVAFTQYLSVYGPANLVGHLFLFLSSFLIYRAIVTTGLKEPAALLFRSLEQSEQALKRSEAPWQARRGEGAVSPSRSGWAWWKERQRRNRNPPRRAPPLRRQWRREGADACWSPRTTPPSGRYWGRCWGGSATRWNSRKTVPRR